jgi:hypothetical protein
MAIDATSTLVDVCFAVCTALSDSGITAVLCGGSAATFYAPGAYQSKDADFVIMMRADTSKGAAAMKRLGYAIKDGTYRHETNRFTVDFPVGPLAISDDLITTWETFQREQEHLNALSRTDVVRDRLSWYYFYTDISALNAAVAVATSGEVDFALLRDWSAREGEMDAFDEFFSLVSPN